MENKARLILYSTFLFVFTSVLACAPRTQNRSDVLSRLGLSTVATHSKPSNLSARKINTARELAESYAYGQNLLSRYDALLSKGYSLKKIMRSSSVYGELQALYFLNQEIERLATELFVDRLVMRLSNEEASLLEKHGDRMVFEEFDRYLDDLRADIRGRHSEQAYGLLATANLEVSLRAMLVGLLGSNPNDERARAIQVMSAAKSLKKDPNAYQAFLPKDEEKGRSIAALVQAEGAEIWKKEFRNLVTEIPGLAQSEKLIYPDPGPAGNIYGTTFPSGVWALTFDDGPHGGSKETPSYTQAVLANLQLHDVPATFFVVSAQIDRMDCPGVEPRKIVVRDENGRVISERIVDIKEDRPSEVFPELALAERDQGHAVGSHSYYHSQVPKGTELEQECEIHEAVVKLSDKLGSRPLFYRLPYGAGVGNLGVRKKIAKEGLVHVHWSVDTLDWQDHDPDSIVSRALQAMKIDGRGIILFHDIHLQSVIASEKIMAQLKDPANHWESLTIPQIVDRMNSQPSP